MKITEVLNEKNSVIRDFTVAILASIIGGLSVAHNLGEINSGQLFIKFFGMMVATLLGVEIALRLPPKNT